MVFGKNKDLSNSLLVVGCGRSGTTWLGETLNLSSDFKIIFEPLSPLHSPVWKKVGWQKPYLTEKSSFKHTNLVHKILSGQIDGNWCEVADRGNSRAKRYLIKEIRVNAMLGWLQHNFPKLKIIFIVRDPYSVAYSCAERGWNDSVINHYLGDARLVRDHLSPEQVTIIKQADNLFKKGMVMWCIENYIALKSITVGPNITSVFYEAAATNPDQEFNRLAKFARIDLSQHLSKESVTKKSSYANHDSVTDANHKGFGHRWQGKISRQDMAYAEEILKAFSLDKLYKERNVPALNQPLDINLSTSRRAD